jgi:beta-galactosidase
MTRNHMGARHNHCYTSPVYREKVASINRELAKAVGNHPGVILWHLSNEYGGTCYCPLCQEAFRGWLKDRYGSLEALNKAWWTYFWSHTYTDWSQIEPPLPDGEVSVHGLNLDWHRFTTDRTIDFIRHETAAVRQAGSNLPVTANFMEFFYDLNYFKFADVLDIISWDSYPRWHSGNDIDTAVQVAACHDLMRSIKQQPFLLMESTPSMTNWMQASKLKRPGMHMLSSMQAVAHGADSVQYFQWRKSRGSSEKFHGAVVSHDGRDDTRVFEDVKMVGTRLKNLDALCNTMPNPQVAILFDWENRWALDDTRGPRNLGLHYQETMLAHYKAFWQMGISVDVVDMECDLSGYKLVVAPMLYQYRAGIVEKLRDFVKKGGTLVGTCFQGVVDETDLCFLGDTPHSLTDVFGLRVEEIDGLYDGETNAMDWNGRVYTLTELCERVHLSTATTLATYQSDFYAGETVFSVNEYGAGKAFYLAAGAESAFHYDFYRMLSTELQLEVAIDAQLPDGVTATRRIGAQTFVILQNFNNSAIPVLLRYPVRDYETNEIYKGEMMMAPYEVKIVVTVANT